MNADRDYLAAGLALGGLSEDELAEARTLAATDADFRAEVDAYADTAALMAMSDEPQIVSEETRSAILSLPETVAQEDSAADADAADAGPAEAADRSPAPLRDVSRPAETGQTESAPTGPAAAGEGSAAPSSAGTGSAAPASAGTPASAGAAPATPRDDQPVDLAERRRRRAWLPWAAAAAAVALVIAGFGVNAWQTQQRQYALQERLDRTEKTLEDTTRLMTAPDLKTSTAELPDGGSVTVVSSETEQVIRVSARDVEAPSGSDLQMWVIDADGPESAGLMSGAGAQIDDRTFAAGSQFGITVEPAGGSPQPTSDPIVAVEL